MHDEHASLRQSLSWRIQCLGTGRHRQEVPDAKLESQRIDLSDLTTVRDFTERALAFPGHQLDVLLNNAGEPAEVVKLCHSVPGCSCDIPMSRCLLAAAVCSCACRMDCRCHGDTGDADSAGLRIPARCEPPGPLSTDSAAHAATHGQQVRLLIHSGVASCVIA